MIEQTFREKCALAIDHSWFFSWYWPEDDWEGLALGQAKARRVIYKDKLAALEEVILALEEETAK